MAAVFYRWFGISKPFKTTFYILAGCGIIVVGLVVFGSRTGLAAQFSNWQITPQPERFTELYFTHPRQLPQTVTSGVAQQISFTVRNFEHRSVAYRYTLVIETSAANKRQVGGGAFLLSPNDSRIVEPFIVPPDFGGRAALKVYLSYEARAFGKVEPTLQTQSVHHWLEATPRISFAERYGSV